MAEPAQGTPRLVRVGDLDIQWDARLLEPRPWTASQGEWAAEVARAVPDGPILELCSGAGHIGLTALRGNDRRLIAVDLEPASALFIRLNAEAAGLGDRVETRTGRLLEMIRPEERFEVIIADPPWVPSARTRLFPEDPRLAIDGGEDGLRVVRDCLRVIERHLAPQGAAIVQLGTALQAEQVRLLLARRGLRLAALRRGPRGRGVLIHVTWVA